VVFEPTLDHSIPQDHPVRLFDELLHRFDWTPWEARYSGRTGRPAIHPRVLASVLLYGLSLGVRSSRRLERACGNAMDFIWLAEGHAPDHTTLCKFRNGFSEELKGLFHAVCRTAIRLGLATLNQVALDGTRVRANSSRHATASAKTIEKRLAELREEIDGMFAEADAADRAENDLFGERVSPNRLPRELARLEQRQEQLEKALEAAKAKEQQAAASSTSQDEDAEEASKVKKKKGRTPRVPVADPDSAVLPNKDGGHAPNYTPMAAADTEGGLILDTDVLPHTDEGSTTVETAKRLHDAYGTYPGQLLADTMHGTGKNLADLAACEVAAYIPPLGHNDTADNPAHRADPAMAVPSSSWDALPRSPQTKRLDRSAFVYDAEADCYWCPQGRRLAFHGMHKPRGRPCRRYRAESSCLDCPHHATCTPQARRHVSHDEHQPHRDAAAARLSTEEGRAIYGRRSPVIEGVMGCVKEALGFRQFLLRGLDRVKTEWLWACTAYNLRTLVRAWQRRPDLHCAI
jgi:transposase